MSEFHRAMTLTGPEPRRLRAAERIGEYLMERKKLVEAEPYLRDALSLRERLFGRTQSETVALRERLGDLYMELGRPSDAAHIMHIQVDLMAAGGYVTTLESAHAAAKLAEALRRQGDLTAAQEVSQKSIAAIEAADPYSPELVQALVSSSKLAMGSGDYSAAERLLQRANDCASRVGSTEGAQLVRSNMLALYVAAGRFADAVPLSKRVLSDNTLGRMAPDPIETSRLHRQHADLLERANRMDEAAKHHRIAETLDRIASDSKKSSPDSPVSTAG
jgi:tetratricopeptide (TPR) repeat protein